MSERAVVFGYHEVGARGLDVLLELGLRIPLVVTHEDDPTESRWFASVRERCDWHRIPVITPEQPDDPSLIERVRAARPDWIFSFYYRRLLGPALLALPPRGAFNLHGSLLPRYRGRAPINWAVLHGERVTGASLHRMVEKPDAGALIDQEAIAILTNDTAAMVFGKLVCAAETLLLRAVPRLLAGTHEERPLDLAAGSYFGGRRPADGRLDWGASAWQVHNLIRAVAPPYPGAFTEVAGHRLELLGSHFMGEAARGPAPRLYWEDARCHADCADGQRIRITRLALAGEALDRERFHALFGCAALALPRADNSDARVIPSCMEST
ncbi:MAG: formyltransferase [Sphingobacteriia bacterium]|nr:formyltransferase [Sphingobacteriia bacterium]NCC39507.1 formyltransferase [Gammaproteobacteria bacterium]